MCDATAHKHNTQLAQPAPIWFALTSALGVDLLRFGLNLGRSFSIERSSFVKAVLEKFLHIGSKAQEVIALASRSTTVIADG